MCKYHLAIDIGSESGRAFVGYLDSGTLVCDEIYRFKTQFTQVREYSIRNIYGYLDEIINSMRIYKDKYGDELGSIGVDAWGSDFVLVGRTGDILKLPSSYRLSSVSTDVSSIVEERYGQKDLYYLNGNQHMPADTLHQLLRLQQSNDPSIDDPQGILFIADIFHYLLGGRLCCEHSLASYCRLFNAEKDTWDLDAFRAFDIPETICTEIVHPGTCTGYVSRNILLEAGLKEPVPIIIPCSHDTACAALSVADPGEDWAFISSGTWSLLGTETEKPVINDIAYINNYSNSSMPLKTNMFKKIITGTWIIQQCAKAWGIKDYNEIVNLADAAKDQNCFIDINGTEFYAPDSMPRAISNAVKRDYSVDVPENDIGQISRIVFQSMALRYRYYLEQLIKATGKEINKIYILGGGSRNRLINAFTASACNRVVSVGVYEASSVGNLLLQAYGCHELKDKQEMRKTVMASFPQTLYFPSDKKLWDDKYAAFLSRAIQYNEF